MTFEGRWLFDTGPLTLEVNNWGHRILILKAGDCLMEVTTKTGLPLSSLSSSLELLSIKGCFMLYFGKCFASPDLCYPMVNLCSLDQNEHNVKGLSVCTCIQGHPVSMVKVTWSI